MDPNMPKEEKSFPEKHTKTYKPLKRFKVTKHTFL